jgi:hypothetical protein
MTARQIKSPLGGTGDHDARHAEINCRTHGGVLRAACAARSPCRGDARGRVVSLHRAALCNHDRCEQAHFDERRLKSPASNITTGDIWRRQDIGCRSGSDAGAGRSGDRPTGKSTTRASRSLSLDQPNGRRGIFSAQRASVSAGSRRRAHDGRANRGQADAGHPGLRSQPAWHSRRAVVCGRGRATGPTQAR